MEAKEFINQHRHTENGKREDNTWGDVDCTEIIDFGTGKSERELTCPICNVSVPAASMAKVVSPYGDNKYGV